MKIVEEKLNFHLDNDGLYKFALKQFLCTFKADIFFENRRKKGFRQYFFCPIKLLLLRYGCYQA